MSVSISIHYHKTLSHSFKHKHSNRHPQTNRQRLHELQSANNAASMHAHTHITNTYAPFIHSSSLTHITTTLPPPIHSVRLTHTDTCTHRLSLFSQLCSDIKRGPLRENKHADEERLAGHRGRQYAHTNTLTHKLTWIKTHANARTGFS